MFEFLNELDPKLYARYQTVETNIKSKSNSFRESVLVLAESFSRYVYDKKKVPINSQYDTLIGILREAPFEHYCLMIGLSKAFYERLFKFAKDCNSHKHHDEITTDIGDVLEYMELIYIYTSYVYRDIKGEMPPKFDKNYFIELYGLDQREVEALLKEKKKLQEFLLNEQLDKNIMASNLARVKEIAKRTKSKNDTLEMEKEKLLKEVSELKDIKLDTMEEKVSRILTVLEKQVKAIEKVGDQLEYASMLRFGLTEEHPGTIASFDDFKLKKLYQEKIEKDFRNFLIENQNKKFEDEIDNINSYKFVVEDDNLVISYEGSYAEGDIMEGKFEINFEYFIEKVCSFDIVNQTSYYRINFLTEWQNDLLSSIVKQSGVDNSFDVSKLQSLASKDE